MIREVTDTASWAANADHFRNSSLREKVIEHLFGGELLRSLWCRGRYDFEVLRAEVDRSGYDLVFECNGVLRHVQLKSSYAGASTSTVDVHVSLQAKPHGCVIWVLFNPKNLVLGPYRWLGEDAASGPLSLAGMRVAKHKKADSKGRKAEKPDIRVMRKASFSCLQTIDEVADRLFGLNGTST